MKITLTLFTSFFLSLTIAFGQNKTKGKVYVSSTLEYLHLINDSTLWTSIGDENDTTAYYIKADILRIKNQYWRTGANHQTDNIIEWHDYKILKQSDDSLFLLNNFKGYAKPYNWEDTLNFISIHRLKETIAKFKHLTLDYFSPFDGTLKLNIDSSGKITYERTAEITSGKETLTSLKGELTKKEFARVLDTLAYSLPSRFAKRRRCGLDGPIIDFEITFNDKTVLSKGCSLKWTHAFLFNYLYDITKNKGFVKRQRK